MSWGHPVAGINIWSPELRRDDKAVPSNRSTGFWLVSGRPNVNAPPRYLTSAISRQAGRLFHPTHPRRVAGSERVPLWWPFFPLEACQSRVTRLCAALVPISTGGTDDHFMKPPRVRWRQEATPDNETGTCTRLYHTLPPSFSPDFSSSGKQKKFVEIFDHDRTY